MRTATDSPSFFRGQDGSITRLEFLSYMLIHTGKISQDDVDEVMQVTRRPCPHLPRQVSQFRRKAPSALWESPEPARLADLR